jgi:hypothetical protein
MAREAGTVAALRFKQWLDEWNGYAFDDGPHRRRPPEDMFLFSMPARDLRALCDVYKRERDGAVSEGIQRYRDPSRTERIQRYVRFGYPFGDLRPPQRTAEAQSLRKPGWLPTAIVVNVLIEGDERRGRRVRNEDLVTIVQEDQQRCHLKIPALADPTADWLAPLEVIDGQHRLWAFEPDTSDHIIPGDFELPVVAFHGLDVAWQAYLFWSINVSPKRINPSHAFDLYPLLRTQDWLERVGELTVYREARAQELTEILYSHSESPWHNRINMLGERGGGGVSQAGWVRALMNTFLSTGRGQSRPGLFQSDVDDFEGPLEWSRSQQAALLIQLWIELRQAIADNTTVHWIREFSKDVKRAFSGKDTWLNQDQGVRAILNVANDIFFERAAGWRLDRWRFESQLEGRTSEEEVTGALASLRQAYFYPRLRELARGLVHFDWRALEAPGVKEDEALATDKRSYRGAGGYAALRVEVLRLLADDENEVGAAARDLLEPTY